MFGIFEKLQSKKIAIEISRFVWNDLLENHEFLDHPNIFGSWIYHIYCNSQLILVVRLYFSFIYLFSVTENR